MLQSSQASIARSYLFVPGSRADRIPKARHAGAEVVIVDLEDAVSPSDKCRARQELASKLDPLLPVLVRINGAETPWFKDDLEFCSESGVGGVMLPKAERADVLETIAKSIGAEKIIVPIIETAKGYDAIRALAATGVVQRFAFGSIDFQVDLRIDGEGEQLLYFRSGIVLASRVAGLQPPIDGVTVSIDDESVLRADTLRGKRLGFGGKLCIHPKQVQTVNSCFEPSVEEIAWAERIVEASVKSNGAAIAVDGKMVDAPVIQKAMEILSMEKSRVEEK